MELSRDQVSVDTTPPETDAQTDPAPRVIKRYANRKLYDTKDSKYVTLLQIASYVREGEDVQIIDNNTKENLTSVTLAQIIYEEQRKGEPSIAPAAGTLRGFIQSGGEKLMATLREGPVGKLIARGDEEPRKSVVASSKEALDDLHRMADERMRALLATVLAPLQQLQSEVRRLQRRIEILERRLVAARRRRRKSSEPRGNSHNSSGTSK